ncbi:hypothetical protein ILUMI_24027 [Ignelater luminosus]|uniref:Uncharacterized protein n=1 Tax=Ignelater luminosus TaxID=2038154 RepID=A0A8K0CBB3_IGNLU|nr:hypothetical protein ILUMI_24027 [Ignelater luminosus]
MTSLQNICEEMEKMCGVAFTSSEQHVEMREARIKRDSIADIHTKQAQEDSDTLIVTTAIELAQQPNLVVIVGEDVDLLVIMIGRCRGVYSNVYFLKPGKGTVSPIIFSPDCKLDESIVNNILFLHAMGGCDTTSASFKVEKMRFLQTLNKNPALSKTNEIFKDPMADADAVTDAGNQRQLLEWLEEVSDCKQDVADSDSEEEFVGKTAEQSELDSESEIE